jgi:hypothetical protein
VWVLLRLRIRRRGDEHIRHDGASPPDRILPRFAYMARTGIHRHRTIELFSHRNLVLVLDTQEQEDCHALSTWNNASRTSRARLWACRIRQYCIWIS